MEVTQSLLRRAKANGYTVLVVTVDGMVLGWRSHDHGTAYSPAGHGLGIQQGTSDPVFMARFGLEARHEAPPFPYVQEDIRRRAADGDLAAQQTMLLGSKWVGELGSGIFRRWDELQFIRDNWDGPIVLKGILAPEVGNLFCMAVVRILDSLCRTRKKQSTWASTALSFPITVSTIRRISLRAEGLFRWTSS